MKFEFSPHIAIQVKKYQEAVIFYRETLGFEYIKPLPESKETHFKSGEMNFYIEDSDKGKVFFEFKVDNVPEAIELLTSQGCTITQQFNEKSIMIADPYGMTFHVYQEGGISYQ